MADEEAPKKKSKLKWIILIIMLLLIGGGGAGAWFFFLKDKFMPADPNAPTVKEVAPSKPAAPMGVTVPLPIFTTNLADPLGQRFIRVTLEVEVADDKVNEEITKHNARIRDSVIMLLSSKTYADIASAESKLLLKSEISDRLNAILGPGKIYQVFITDMVIQ